ncbi:hypothetical protein LUZ60_002893 [Juncus effusus]|nr:hypothetical protein LUZ60_002893 [Juncus effusus]
MRICRVYRVKISNYSQIKHFASESELKVGSFDLAGHSWAIIFRTTAYDKALYISFIGLLLTETNMPLNMEYEFCLLDQNGKSSATKKWYQMVEQKGNEFGLQYFMKKTEFESSVYLKDDCFILQCALRVVKPSCVDETKKQVVVPSSDLHQHLAKLLESKEGANVTFVINGEIFVAHKNLLATRSPVFRAQFFGSMMETEANFVKIDDVKPEIFKLMLHFIYTDILPREVEISCEMAQHFLVAADRYGLERLKLLSAEILCKNLSVENSATTLVLAEQHNCQRLKEVCIDFVSSREVLNAVMASEGFSHLMESCPSILKELLEKLDNGRRF